MIKNPRLSSFRPHFYANMGQPHPAVVLAASRRLPQSAKRRARIPYLTHLYHGLYDLDMPQTRKEALRRSIPSFHSPQKMAGLELLKGPDPKVVYELVPSFSKVPLDLIRDALLQTRVRIGAATETFSRPIKSFMAEPPLAVIPKEMEIIQEDWALAFTATHYLAIYTQNRFDELDRNRQAPRLSWSYRWRRLVEIYPIKAVVLALWCSYLPPIPPPQRIPKIARVQENNDERDIPLLWSVTLPVLPLSLPYPEVFLPMFELFHTGNYTKFHKEISGIEPMEPPANANWSFNRKMVQHAANIANVCRDRSVIYEYRQKIWATYQNALKLGVSEPKFWEILRMTWGGNFRAITLMDRKRDMEIEQKKDCRDMFWITQDAPGSSLGFICHMARLPERPPAPVKPPVQCSASGSSSHSMDMEL